MSEETNEKIEKMDNYTIKHFRVAFGNRIVKHMRAFVPVYVACGGDETAGVDHHCIRKRLIISKGISSFLQKTDHHLGINKILITSQRHK